jgi:hypothetical protein
MIDINITYPYRGISRAPSCVYQSSYQMYVCPNTVDYRMLIIESMDSDTETRRLSPVAVMSDNGYIDLINGPQDHGWCNGYTCQKRISTFMSLVEGGHHYDIYLTSTTPNDIRFRLLNSDATIRVSLGLYYSTLEQIDVYANGNYVAPTNKDNTFTFLMLLDQPNGVSLSSPPGANFFNRSTQMEIFLIDGVTVIDLVISDLIVLTFGLPATTPSAFFSTNLVANLAALLGVTTDQIRRVDIISATNTTRVRRQAGSTIYLQVTLRNDPPASLTTSNSVATDQILNWTSIIINQCQTGEMATAMQNLPNGVTPDSCSIREPGNSSTVTLAVIAQLVLVIPPASCRVQSACSQQPKLVAYDSTGAIITKLGSDEFPWQVQATVIGSSGVGCIGSIANYTNGAAQFTSFGLTAIGSYQVQFSFLVPNGCSSTIFASSSLIASVPSVSVGNAVLSAAQYGYIDVTAVNQTFNFTAVIIDKATQLPIGSIQWSTFTWSAAVSLYTDKYCVSNGTLLSTSSSAVIVDTTSNTINATFLKITEPGMYIIHLLITSSDGVYTIPLTSNAILVVADPTALETYTGPPPVTLTFDGNYNDYVNNGQLEILLCGLYNHLFFIVGLPISSNVTVWSGSIHLGLVLNTRSIGSPVQTGNAIQYLVNNPNSPAITFISASVNGKTYSASASAFTTTDSTSYGQVNSTGMIVGIVLGVCALAAAIALTTYGVKKYKQKNRGQRLINDEHDVERGWPSQSAQNNGNTTIPSTSTNNPGNVTRGVSIPSSNVPNININRLHSPLQNSETEQRVPSAAPSVTRYDCTTPVSRKITDVELLTFE